MAISIVTGTPRSGKGMVCAAIALIEMRRGRRVCADYFLHGAYPWVAWEDCCSPAYAGSLFIADEVGSSYSARDTMDLDMMVFAAATMHAKQGVDMILQAQSLMFVDIQMRRLAADIMVVHRVGFNGHRLVEKDKKTANKDWSLLDSLASIWMRPWFFIVRHYFVTDFKEDGELKATARARYTDYYFWTRERAMAYNTQQLVIPDHLRARFESASMDAQERSLRLPPMERGKVYDPSDFLGIPTYERQPRRETIKDKYKTPLMDDIVRARGFYSEGENWATPNPRHIPIGSGIMDSAAIVPLAIGVGADAASEIEQHNGWKHDDNGSEGD